MSLARNIGLGLDRIISAVAPKLALQREAARLQNRQLVRASGAWDGAATSRRWSDRSIMPGSANSDLDRDDLDRLRSRSRDRWRNDGLAHGAIGSMAEGITGTGLRPLLRLDHETLGISRDEAKALQRQAAQIWREWSATADAAERVHMDQLQALVVSSALMSGDVFVRPLMVTSQTQPSRFELRLDIIESDRCDSPNGIDRPGEVQSGVVLGTRGEPTHYWISREHPGDHYGARTFDRVPRVDGAGRPSILHVYDVERPGQSRGRPLLSPVLDAFKDLDDYVEAELIRSQVAACFAAFVKRTDPYGAALAATASGGQASTQREMEIVPGGVHFLASNEDVTFGNPSSPNAAFDGFMRTARQMICAPLGIPYEIAARDLRGMNYSNARAAFLMAWQTFGRRQRWLVNCLLQPVWQMLLEEAWLKGVFAARDFSQRQALWSNTIWIAPGKGWIDPLKEVQAEALRLKEGLTTRQQIVARYDGADWETEIAPQLVEEEALLVQLRAARGVEPPAKEADAPQNPQPQIDPAEEPEEATV